MKSTLNNKPTCSQCEQYKTFKSRMHLPLVSAIKTANSPLYQSVLHFTQDGTSAQLFSGKNVHKLYSVSKYY